MTPLSLEHMALEPRISSEGKAPLLILLHGIGSNEQDLFGLAPDLDHRLRIISARAPLILGRSAFAWYHLEFTPAGPVAIGNDAELSRLKITGFIKEAVEAYDCDPDRVFLMGFSQGCIMSLSVALTEPRLLAGVVGMSGRWPAWVDSFVARPELLAGLPILIVHGTEDTVLSISDGRNTRDRLTKLPVRLEYKEYRMAHQVSFESLTYIKNWLTARLDSRENWLQT